MSSLRTAKDCQDSEMSNMQKEISTPTRALTTLTHTRWWIEVAANTETAAATKVTEAMPLMRVKRRTPGNQTPEAEAADPTNQSGEEEILLRIFEQKGLEIRLERPIQGLLEE